MVKSQTRLGEEQPIERHIGSGWDRYPGWRDDAQLRESGVVVWVPMTSATG